VDAVRAVIAETGVRCVFSEPQFSDRVLAAVTEGSDVRRGRLDPLGADLTPGPALYAATLEGMADSFVGCLAP
jgi:zinc transport system substrate-binding protein